jgi:GTP 3',8-cyclase
MLISGDYDFVFVIPNHSTSFLHHLSLDTLDPFKFELMTRRMGHDAVLRSLNMAVDSPALETKLNAVVVKGLNDHEVLDFVGLTKDKPLSVRFIEFMPFTGMSLVTYSYSFH